MCSTTPPEEWRGIGIAQWKGELYVLEACDHCSAYRAAQLDVDEIPVVEHHSGSTPTGVTKSDASDRDRSAQTGPRETGDGADTSRSDGTEETDGSSDGDDWLIE